MKNVNNVVLKKKYSVTSFTHKEKTVNNDNIEQEINDKFSNDDDVKSEPIIKYDESSNEDDINRQGSSVSVSNLINCKMCFF